ncbi:hypothetical protein ACFXGT_31840 [Streptomyces sp. NPDC059352]|uniref:hypothetical protein n=1 Tax=Streptomyces sp. NPDC059352 TaxID=3346810 RepID=UPI0036981268
MLRPQEQTGEERGDDEPWGDVGIARADIEDSVELLPAGALGEIVVRGHNVFAGCFGRPEETAKALVDGWLRTGEYLPRIVVRTDAMPLGPSHKVLKRELRQRYGHLVATDPAGAVGTSGAGRAPPGRRGSLGRRTPPGSRKTPGSRALRVLRTGRAQRTDARA